MNKKKIVYVTGNKMKVDYLKSILSQDFEVIGKKIDCPEIQADEIEEIAANSSKYASDVLKEDVLKNDSGLVIPALNGFPGPYSKYVESKLGHEGMLKLMSNIENREAYYLDAFAYCRYGEEPVVFVSKSYGRIAESASGEFGNSFDKIFIPNGKEVTMANMSYDDFLSSFDNTALYDLAKYLDK